MFFNRQVLTNVVPAVISVLSGTVTSETNDARSQGIGMGVEVGGTGVLVGRGTFVGAMGVSEGTMTTGWVGEAAIAPVVDIAITMGVPAAAWVCWAIKVCAAAV